jgi:hypothetical protein
MVQGEGPEFKPQHWGKKKSIKEGNKIHQAPNWTFLSALHKSA